MNLSKFNLFFAFAALFLCATCGDLSINRGDATPGVRTIVAASGSIADSSKTIISGGYLLSKAVGTTDVVECAYDSGHDGATTAGNLDVLSDVLSSTTKRVGQAFRTNSLGWMQVVAINVYLFRNGNPTGNLKAELREISGGGNLPPSTAGTQTNTVNQSAVDDNTGALVAFNYASPVDLAVGKYALVLTPNANQVPGEEVMIFTSDNATTACSSGSLEIGEATTSTNSGTSFSAGSAKKSIFSITATQFAATGAVTWTVSAFSNAQWDLSTFTADENPNSTGGTITYDLGAGDDFSSPAYSLTGLTKAQVLASTDLVGTYLFVRAHLASDAPSYHRAVLGDMTIEAKAGF